MLPTLSKLLLLALPAVVLSQTVPAREFKYVTLTATAAAPAGTALTEGFAKARPQTQRVAYYVDRGYAIANGDINMGLESDVLAQAGPNTRHRRRNEVVDKRSFSIWPSWTGSKWPDATLQYKFYDTDAETALASTLNSAFARWTEASPFLRFQKHPTSDVGVNGVITIVKTVGAAACWAPLGYGNYPMTISLDVNCNVANTVHEIGHALGLYHEHQRPDRDDSVFFNCSALIDYPEYGGPYTSCPGEPEKCCEDSTCWGWACSFNHLYGLDYDGEYDVHSVMHYREDGFAAWGHKTLVGLNGKVVNPIDYEFPTDLDKKRICEIYSDECNGPKPPAVCGNGILEAGEECDDGNNVDGDKCSAVCKIEPINSGNCAVCQPDPFQNKCDITTSCITIAAGVDVPHYCACRAGYKAAGNADNQWRMPFINQEYRVFVEPGVACDTLCDDWQLGAGGCTQVPVKTDCN